MLPPRLLIGLFSLVPKRNIYKAYTCKMYCNIQRVKLNVLYPTEKLIPSKMFCNFKSKQSAVFQNLSTELNNIRINNRIMITITIIE